VNPANRWLVGIVAAGTITTVAFLEGYSNDPYKDIVGVQTVCYGETNVKMRRYSDAECNAMLQKSLVKYGNGILECIRVPISQNQHAAFSSFAYNVGLGAFCGSSLVKKLNRGDYENACRGMYAWTYAGGKHVQGLKNRRDVEVRLCLKGST
jgi:lysozyme